MLHLLYSRNVGFDSGKLAYKLHPNRDQHFGKYLKKTDQPIMKQSTFGVESLSKSADKFIRIFRGWSKGPYLLTKNISSKIFFSIKSRILGKVRQIISMGLVQNCIS
jgi:hypothetical protein